MFFEECRLYAPLMELLSEHRGDAQRHNRLSQRRPGRRRFLRHPAANEDRLT